MRYTQFYNCARCCPTRASLLTGMYPHRAAIGSMTSETPSTYARNQLIARPSYQGYLGSNTATIAEAVRAAGYQTFMTGKWHVGSHRPNWPTDRGFDRYFGILRGACDYWSPAADAQLLEGETPVTDLPGDFYTTDYFARRAAELIQEADDRPYFLYLSFNAPHWPLHAWPEDIEKYRGAYLEGWDTLRERRLARQKELGLFSQDLPLSPRDPECPPWQDIADSPDVHGRTFTAAEWDHRMAVYAAMIDRVDRGVGTVLDAVRSCRDPDNTVVMFLSDNGACAEYHDPVPDVPAGPPGSDTGCLLPWANLSNTPFRLFKRWLHEGGSATPFIFHYPRLVREGRIESKYYAHVKDIMPTCLSLSGAAYPTERAGRQVRPLDGRSFLANVEGTEEENAEALFFEHEGNRAVRRGRWKLVSYYSEARGFRDSRVGTGLRTGRWELYNLEDDRVELNDLSAAEPQVRDELIEQYGAFAERTGVADWQQIQRELEAADSADRSRGPRMV